MQSQEATPNSTWALFDQRGSNLILLIYNDTKKLAAI
jgi:hypothetical protein